MNLWRSFDSSFNSLFVLLIKFPNVWSLAKIVVELILSAIQVTIPIILLPSNIGQPMSPYKTDIKPNFSKRSQHILNNLKKIYSRLYLYCRVRDHRGVIFEETMFPHSWAQSAFDAILFVLYLGCHGHQHTKFTITTQQNSRQSHLKP